MLGVLLLGTCSIIFIRLRHPLIHGRLNKILQFLAHLVTEVVRVVERSPPNRILHEWIQIVVKALSDQLYVRTLHCHHNWGDSRVGRRV